MHRFKLSEAFCFVIKQFVRKLFFESSKDLIVSGNMVLTTNKCGLRLL